MTIPFFVRATLVPSLPYVKGTNGRAFPFWYPRWESNPQLRFRRALVYPFTYGDLLCLIAYI